MKGKQREGRVNDNYCLQVIIVFVCVHARARVRTLNKQARINVSR